MSGSPRVLGLLEEMLDAGRTPEEVCRDCPELLAEVRERWREFRLIDAAVVEVLPGLRTTPAVGAVPPVPPPPDLPQVSLVCPRSTRMPDPPITPPAPEGGPDAGRPRHHGGDRVG